MMEEMELDQAMSKNDSLNHQVQYHLKVGRAVKFKEDLLELCDIHRKTQKTMIENAVALQEESLLLGITCK